MTTNKEPRRPNEHAAALARAHALRLLFRYRYIRDEAAYYDGDVGDLPEAPRFDWLGTEYAQIMDEWANHELEGPLEEVEALQLVAAILDDAVLGSEGTTLGGEARFFHALTLVQHVCRKANHRSYALLSAGKGDVA
jgi:hypothetical protein